MNRLVIIALLAFLAVVALANRGTAQILCAGCEGSETSSQTTTLGVKWVSVVVTVADGFCQDGETGCVSHPCEWTATRAWGGQSNGAKIDLCVHTIGGTTVCRDPQPTVDSTGAGSDTESDYVRCGATKQISITIGTLSAHGTASCTSCGLAY